MIKEFKSNTVKLKLDNDTAGLYKCQASNIVGSIEKIIHIAYTSKYLKKKDR